VRVLAALAGLLMLCGAAATIAPVPTATGEKIYREGRLESGEPLRAVRRGAPPVQGRDVACVQCHRRSGLGMVEGRNVIPPITGRALYQPGRRLTRDTAMHEGETYLLPTPPDRAAYDDASLARAIRDGVGAGGRPLDYLMPRYDLDDVSMRELIAYLKQLSVARVPGVGESTLDFATIITPDADPVARDGMLTVLQNYFAEKNSRYIGEAVTPLLQDGRPVRLQTQRRWRLHVWQLQGGPETWEAQLDDRQRREPVFAVISGLGGSDWNPVHRFCERQAIPCLLPNVDLPVVQDGEFYSVYFSQGVLLEAQLVGARTLRERVATGRSDAGADRAPPRGRVVQVFRADDIGAAGAVRLRRELADDFDGIDLGLRREDGPRELAHAIAQARHGDTLVLWLRARDLAALPAPPAGLAAAYVSGLMGSLEDAPLPPAWREVALLTYPCALPDERSLRLSYPLGWFHLRQVPVVAERVQVDTYIACSVLLETLASMLDEFVPDFLVERVEMMMDSRIVNGYYTRLGLAQGQRFASKGGYLVRFSGPAGQRVVADGEWIVP